MDNFCHASGSQKEPFSAHECDLTKALPGSFCMRVRYGETHHIKPAVIGAMFGRLPLLSDQLPHHRRIDVHHSGYQHPLAPLAGGTATHKATVRYTLLRVVSRIKRCMKAKRPREQFQNLYIWLKTGSTQPYAIRCPTPTRNTAARLNRFSEFWRRVWFERFPHDCDVRSIHPIPQTKQVVYVWS
jgi:hypothetical protein